MKAIRLAITLFVLLLVAVSAMGWIWTGAHQPSVQSTASRVVLSLGIGAGLIGLTAIWRYSQDVRR
jgi:hypothetical protein